MGMWIARSPGIGLAIVVATLFGCTDPTPKQGAARRRSVRQPPVELPTVELVASSAESSQDVPLREFHRLVSQIQADARQIGVPGSLTYRIGDVPENAALSFGYAVTGLRDPRASVGVSVTVSGGEGEEEEVALETTLSNFASRPRLEVAAVATTPRGSDPERLSDGEYGLVWKADGEQAPRIDIELARPSEVTAFSIGGNAVGAARGGIPIAMRVALSSDGRSFGAPLRIDHIPRSRHQWHLLPGESVRALRIWIDETHNGQPVALDEILLTDEVDRRALANRLGLWNRSSIDLARFQGRSVEVSFRFEEGRSPLPEEGVTAIVSGPRVDLKRRSGELNVVLVSVDTVRADRLSAYGYQRPTTPFLNQLVEQPGAVRFDNVRSTSTWTPPSHLAMMVGRTPLQLNVHATRSRMLKWRRGRGGLTPLHPSVPTLASILRARGYKTVAFSSAGGTVGEFGLRNGFDVYDQPWNLLPGRPLDYFSELVSKTARIGDWIEANRDRKFFLFLHTYVAHAPYKKTDFVGCEDSDETAETCRRYLAKLHRADNRLRRGGEWGNRGEGYREAGVLDAKTMSDLYDSGLQLMDEFLKGIVESLDRLDLRKDTLVVITSDHGEPFAEHDNNHFKGEHGYSWYDEYLRIPLILLVPGLDAPIQSDVPASLVDVAPTVLDLVGVDSSVGFEGRTLVPAIDGGGEDLELRPIFYEVMAEEKDEDHHFIAASKGRFKILANTYNLRDGRHELYDLEADPGETLNLAEQKPQIAADLLAEIDRHLAEVFRGMVVLDFSKLSDPSMVSVTGAVSFSRPVELFDLAVRQREDRILPKKDSPRRRFKIDLLLGGERRLIGFRPPPGGTKLGLRFRATQPCAIRAGELESRAIGKQLNVSTSEIATKSLPLQSDLQAERCAIRISYIEPGDGVAAGGVGGASNEISEEDRARILEQMRALGYID